MVQSQLWDKIKTILPGFIQGLTKKQMMDTFKSKVSHEYTSISIDGSAFDSTQRSELMEVADNCFWDIVYSDILRILEFNEFEHPELSTSNLVNDAKIYNHYMFTKLEGYNGPEWSLEMLKSYYATIPKHQHTEEPHKSWV